VPLSTNIIYYLICRMSRGERGIRVEKRGTVEDGFIWRKYGQKDIHGSNYPRSV